MNLTVPAAQRFFVCGRPFELWDNPEQPFGWTPADLQSYANNGEWELLFNALVIAASPAAADEVSRESISI